MRRGRLVFPAADALVAAIVEPFPLVMFRDGRCPYCWGPGLSWNVVQRTSRGGAMASHRPGCRELA